MENQKVKRERVIKGGFTLVELLVVVAILSVLSGAAYLGISRSQVRVMNAKVTDDLSSIENALNQYKEDNGVYPLPSLSAISGLPLEENKNVLCFGEDLDYIHDCSQALFMQTQVDNDLLTKRYLQEVPTDPRTHSRYMYGVTRDGKYFQVAGNYEEDDGYYTARTFGNLETYPFLSGLIRAFDSPDFVVNGEGWLPYSPDHMSITATVAHLSGSATIDGKSASVGSIIHAGEEIITDSSPGTSAVLYFSDGSVTYLDPDTTLRLLPNSEILQNDDDGIITKIRLKLTSGKIWNKVVRLAQESEFNVETTSAIAGVRGTEFGIDSTGTGLVIRNGSVVARRLKPYETEIASDSFLEFDSHDNTVFSSDKLASGNGDFRSFEIPYEQSPMPTNGTPVPNSNEYLEKYYTPVTFTLSGADTPYIVSAKSNTDGAYTLYITFNGFEDDGQKEVSGFEIYGISQTASLRMLKKGALPLLITDNASYNLSEKAYILTGIDYTTQSYNPLYNASENKMESLVLRAFHELNDKRVYSRLSWPAISLTPDQHQIETYDFDNSQVYQEFFAIAESQAPTGPKITSYPTSVQLSVTTGLAADKSCNWSIQGGGGNLSQPYLGVQTVSYEALKTSMTVDQRISDVQARFTGASNDSVTIRCTDPNNPNLYDEKTFAVNYEPSNTSILTGYEYSWFAQGATDWNTAKTLCANLTEGGVGNWTLPSYNIYNSLDPNQDKTDPMEGTQNWCGTWSGNDCTNMPDQAASIWLFEEDPNDNTKAYIVFGNILTDIIVVPKASNTASYSFRCVK